MAVDQVGTVLLYPRLTNAPIRGTGNPVVLKWNHLWRTFAWFVLNFTVSWRQQFAGLSRTLSDSILFSTTSRNWTSNKGEGCKIKIYLRCFVVFFCVTSTNLVGILSSFCSPPSDSRITPTKPLDGGETNLLGGAHRKFSRRWASKRVAHELEGLKPDEPSTACPCENNRLVDPSRFFLNRMQESAKIVHQKRQTLRWLSRARRIFCHARTRNRSERRARRHFLGLPISAGVNSR